MVGPMHDALLPAVAAPAFVILLLWMITYIDYRIDPRHVRVILGPVTLRKIALSDILFADTSAPFWNEHWCSTLFPKKRVVRLRRKTGLVRNFIITPADRDRFLATLRPLLDTPVTDSSGTDPLG